MEGTPRRLPALRDDVWLLAVSACLIVGIGRHMELLGAALALLGWRVWRRHARRRAGGALLAAGALYALLVLGYDLLDAPVAGGAVLALHPVAQPLHKQDA